VAADRGAVAAVGRRSGHRRLAILAAVVAVVALGCDYVPGAPTRLDGTIWRVIEVGGIGPVPGTEPILRFVAGQVQGETGCNSFSGLFILRPDGAFMVGDLATTLIGCEGPVSLQEASMLRALQSADRIVLDGARLSIEGPAGRIVLEEGAG
jgi:heat shock protein HslJ